MHFTIPYTEEIADENGKKLDIFKIYINGAHHCSSRYSRLHQLYNDLKQRFTVDDLPYFPPKRLLKLNESQLEERRECLEHFLQKVSSSSKLNSNELHEFLKACQKETKKIIEEPVTIEVHLMDWRTKYELHVHTTDHTKTVYDSLAKLINLPLVIRDMFALYFMAAHPDGQLSIIRKLQEFEYPSVSLQEVRRHYSSCVIAVRKSVWSCELDCDIVEQGGVGLDILFAQVAAEIRGDWIAIPDEARRARVTNLIERRARKEMLQLAGTLDFYGYVQLRGLCLCSRPTLDTEAVVSAGNYELVLRDEGPAGAVLARYCLTRIKAWKISTTCRDVASIDQHPGKKHVTTLSFEYLDIDTKKLDEVTITNSNTDQVILLSMSLKAMAEEYVLNKQQQKQQVQTSKAPRTGGDCATSKCGSRGKAAGGAATGFANYKSSVMCSLYIGDGDL